MSTTTPEARLRAAYDEYATASRLLWDLRPHGARSEIWKADVAMRAAAEKFNNVKAATRGAFAKSRGWRYDRKKWVHVPDYGEYCRRIVKHPEFFRNSEGSHVGMITHSAAKLEEISAFAARRGYNAELLPFSWDAPNHHTAVLFTLKAGATWP
jgi:hypothetical protein